MMEETREKKREIMTFFIKQQNEWEEGRMMEEETRSARWN